MTEKEDTSLVVPPAIDAVIATLDQSSTEISEFDFERALNAACRILENPSAAEKAGMWTEVLAFSLASDSRNHSPWNTYFGPVGSGVTKDGRAVYFPDIANTPPEAIRYWIGRANCLNRPMLKARYADLAWDMGRVIGKTAPNPDMARIAIDAYVVQLEANLRTEIHDEFAVAIRALDLAQMLRDNARIDAARIALLSIHRKVMVENMPTQWWKAFDCLVNDRHAATTEQEMKQLLVDLGILLTRFSNISDPQLFDPHAAESVAGRLSVYYRKLKEHDEVFPIKKIVGQSFEHAASLADPMLASAFLQTAVTAYRDARLPERAGGFAC